MTTTTGARAADDVLAAARALAPAIRAHADAAERERRLPAALVEAFREAGLFRLWLPARIGGAQLDPLATLRVVEALAETDGSCAWAVMVAAQCASFLPLLEEEMVAATFTRDDILAGTLGQMAAVPVEGGYRVSGRAAFASGCTHASWIIGNGRVMREAPADAGASPELRWLFFRAADCRILDTWHTTGLRGSGSFDYEVADVFVPDALASGPQPTDRFARWGGPLYRGPFLWPMRGALALGIARHAIDALVELATTRTPLRETRVLRELPRAQAAVARAEAAVAAARGYLHSAVAEAWSVLERGERLSEEQRARMALATVHAVTACEEAVEGMYRLGGGASIYATSPLERCFRDINTLMADQSAAPWVLEAAGRVYLGLELPRGVF